VPANALFFQLPAVCRAKESFPYLSANAQIYVICKRCGWEDRANPMYLRPPKSLLTEPCRQCRSKKRGFVRHLEQVEGHCLDCGHNLADTITAPWLELKCANCGSHHLDIGSMVISPPFPLRFGELGDPTLGMGKEQPWGVDPLHDGEHINKEVKWAVQMFPDSHLHMLCGSLFCNTLCTSGAYEDLDQFCWLVSLQGGLLREYFRMTGEFAAGLRGLELEEQAAAMAVDRMTRAGIEHNCAIAIGSLLARYTEDVVIANSERPQIRLEGVAAALRALAVYEEQAATESQGESAHSNQSPGLAARHQVGRTHHLIGDLIAGGDERQIPEALEHFEQALKCDLPDKLAVAVLQSRAETIIRLADPTREQLLQAEQDLITSISADTKRLARSSQWARFLNLATISRKLGARDRELVLLENGASLALEQIRQNPEEFILQQRSERMSLLFDTLAFAYAEAGRALDSLTAVEALRAATVRLHTMDETDREKLDNDRQSILGRDLMPETVRESLPTRLPSPSMPEPIEPIVLGLLNYLKDVPTACISYFIGPPRRGQERGMVALICGPSGSELPKVELVRWPQSFESLIWTEELVSPGPFREASLKKMHAAIYGDFVAPIEPTLRQMKVKRIVFSLPSFLATYAFEALMAGSQPDEFLLDRYEVAYVPSLTLGFDLVKKRAARGNGRLLTVGYQGDDLTNAAKEVDVLRTLFGSRMVLVTGADCNKVNVLRELGRNYDYIHFVCHGTYDSESPLNSALHFVPDVQDDSQRLTAGDILTQVEFRNCPVVTMSACSTAIMTPSEANNCHGLTGALLRAGARSIIGSRWPVYDRTAAAFMSSFYQKLTCGNGSPNVLRCLVEVQREIRTSQGIENFAAFGYVGIP
jgi:hypothetical protein